MSLPTELFYITKESNVNQIMNKAREGIDKQMKETKLEFSTMRSFQLTYGYRYSQYSSR